ncbi:hypothetical protein HN652_01030 [archaeon]|jgi:hypothetical protein|nr:hypothetical protein [archaeon]MBT6868925.1 hypothetical protein [archaeon]MBT7192854.1 hypothetical protein [archaeon]MBT7380820.1 hypothetical protein [archaeon]MBT7507575.1 hypothetical protein [archaeon]
MDNKTLCALALLSSSCYERTQLENISNNNPKRDIINSFFELSKPLSNPIRVNTNNPSMYPGTLDMIPTLDHEENATIVWDYARKFNGERRTAKFYTAETGEPIHFILTNHSLNVEGDGYTCVEKYMDACFATDEFGVTREVRPDGIPDYISLTMGCVNLFGFKHTMEIINNQENIFTGGQYVIKDNLHTETRDFFTKVYLGHIQAENMFINGLKYQPGEGEQYYARDE